MSNFYNTIEASGQSLIDFEASNQTSSEKVLAFFERHKGQSFTPFEVAKELSQYPITSIRRAITDLTNQNKLIKNDKEQQRTGQYGKPNYTWTLNSVN